MIAKNTQGAGFRGVLQYVFKADAEVIGGNMSGADPRSLSREFGTTRQLREDIEKPCYHLSLSLPAGEVLSPDEWNKVSNQFLARLGISPTTHQHVIVQHNDTDYNHIHIVVSRISLDGRIWKPEFDRLASNRICRELEKEHGLTVVSSERVSSGHAKTTQSERQMNKREGRDSEKVFVSETIKSVLEQGPFPVPVQAFCAELEARGVVAVPAIASTGRTQGFSFQHGGRSYTGAQVGYGWKYLHPSITITERDISFLQARKSRLQQGTSVDALRSIKSGIWEVAVRGVAFEKALEAQGWTVRDGQMEKGGRVFQMSELVDVTTLNDHLTRLQSVSQQARAEARERCRELARQKYWQPRHSFMREIGQEDVLFALVLFPQLIAFLLVLGALAVVVRQMDEQTLKNRMGEAWKTAQSQVNEAIVEAQKELVTDERTAGSGQANQHQPQGVGAVARDASHGGRQDDASMGRGADGASIRDEDSGTRDAGRGKTASVATESAVLGDADGVLGRNEPFTTVSLPAGGEPVDVQTAVDTGAVAEWLTLAHGIAEMAGGESRMKTEAREVKRALWERQNRALNDSTGVVRYSIVCVPRGEGNRVPWLPGRHGDTETFFSAEQVVEQIPTLSMKNMDNYDVFIRPRTGRYLYPMVDDLSRDAIERMKSDGLQPSLVLETSAGNYQAIFKVLRTPSRFVGDPMREAEEEAGRALVRELTSQYGGDMANAGAHKGFRLAGFSNKKPGRASFFTGVIEVSEVPCPKVAELFRGHAEAVLAETTTKEVERRQAVIRGEAGFTIGEEGPQLADEARKTFVRFLHKAEGLAKAKGWQMDQSSMDYRACVDMLIDKWNEPTVAECLRQLSPELVERHRDYTDYVERTVTKARAGAEKERERRADAERRKKQLNELSR